METDREVIAHFKEWRAENGMPFNANFVPRTFESIKDLEHEYWKKEQAALNFERDVKTKALPPVRPRRKPQRTVTTLKNGDLRVKPDGYVTGDDLKACMDFIKSEFEDTQKSVQAALDKRTKRIEELEARPVGLDYKGTYKRDYSYAKNVGVTHAGSVWVAIKDKPPKEPGQANSGWQLAVKRGKDGKDGAVR